MSLDNCRLIELPQIKDVRGNLSVIEGNRHIPFEIKRVYYLYDLPAGAERGGHAHKALHQLIIAMNGNFDVLIDDGNNKSTINLGCPSIGLYICPYIWRELANFSPGATCMVLASEYYDELDYYRNYSEFIDAIK